MAKRFSITGQIYNGQRSVIIDDACNAFTVINKGNTIIVLNGISINPNDSLEVRGDPEEYFGGRVDLAFNQAGVTSPVNNAQIVQKIALDDF